MGDEREVERAAHDELLLYTLAHPDPRFPHQHAVDARALTQADGHTKPIALAFALLGLCLHLERGFSGRDVQRVHMDLARKRVPLPTFRVPAARSALRVTDVLAAAPGPERDRALEAWCASVWAAWASEHAAVRAWLARCGLG